jgi:hypothetical protein
MGEEGAACMIGAVSADRSPLRRHPGTSARGHFAGAPTRSLHPLS